MAEKYSVVWTQDILLTRSLVDGHLGFHFLPIMNNTAMSIRVQVFVWTCFHLPSMGVADSYTKSIKSVFFFIEL